MPGLRALFTLYALIWPTIAFANDPFVVLEVRQTPFFSTKLIVDDNVLSTFPATANIQNIEAELDRKSLESAGMVKVCFVHNPSAPNQKPNAKNLATLKLLNDKKSHKILYSASPSATHFSPGSETCKEYFMGINESGLLIGRTSQVTEENATFAPPVNVISAEQPLASEGTDSLQNPPPQPGESPQMPSGPRPTMANTPPPNSEMPINITNGSIPPPPPINDYPENRLPADADLPLAQPDGNIPPPPPFSDDLIPPPPAP